MMLKLSDESGSSPEAENSGPTLASWLSGCGVSGCRPSLIGCSDSFAARSLSRVGTCSVMPTLPEAGRCLLSPAAYSMVRLFDSQGLPMNEI